MAGPLEEIYYYTAFDQEPLVLEIEDPEQVPKCGYILLWLWRYIEPESGQLVAIPEIFTTSDR